MSWTETKVLSYRGYTNDKILYKDYSYFIILEIQDSLRKLECFRSMRELSGLIFYFLKSLLFILLKEIFTLLDFLDKLNGPFFGWNLSIRKTIKMFTKYLQWK